MTSHTRRNAVLAALLAAGSALAQDASGADAVTALDLAARVGEPIAVVVGAALDRGARSAAGLLLSDPAVRALWSHAMVPVSSSDVADSGAALDQLAELLAMSTGEFELVVTRLPRAGERFPGILGRFRLHRARAERVRLALEDGTLAEPARQLGSVSTFTLKSSSDARSHRGFELALVGADLIVGNHATDLEEVLVPPSGRSAPEVAAMPAGPLLLPDRGALPPGAVAAALDWARIAARLARYEEVEEHRLIRLATGVRAARRCEIVVEPMRRGLRTVVQIRPSGAAGGGGASGLPTLELLVAMPVREFLEDLPLAPCVAVTMTFDRGHAAGIENRRDPATVGADFGMHIGAHLDRVGMHAEPALLGALTPLGDGAVSLQIFQRRDPCGRVALRSVAAMHIGNRADAAAALKRYGDVASGFGIFAAVGDAVAIGADRASIEAAQQAAAIAPAGSKLDRARRQRVARALGRLRTERAIAAFRIDLPAGDGRGHDGRKLDNALDGSHIGVVSLVPNEGSGRRDVRIEMLSSM